MTVHVFNSSRSTFHVKTSHKKTFRFLSDKHLGQNQRNRTQKNFYSSAPQPKLNNKKRTFTISSKIECRKLKNTFNCSVSVSFLNSTRTNGIKALKKCLKLITLIIQSNHISAAKKSSFRPFFQPFHCWVETNKQIIYEKIVCIEKLWIFLPHSHVHTS